MTHISFRRLFGSLALSAGVVALGFVPSQTASAHANAVACIDQVTSTWRITNDFPLVEAFTSGPAADNLTGPAGNVASGNGQFTDVVFVGDQLVVRGAWSDGFVGFTTGTGDCTPDNTTTTEATTSTTSTEVTTTTEAASTTTSTSSTTTVPASTTTVDSSTTTTEPATSSSVETTSTTSEPPSSAGPSTTVPSSTTPAPSSTTPECQDNPNTPQDDCNPVCVPVPADINGDGDTTDQGENSCYRLPATGSDTSVMALLGIMLVISGGALVLIPKRR